MAIDNIITEEKIIALVNGLYAEYCKQYGIPDNPLKQIVIGNLECDNLGMCTQLLGKSHIAISNEYIGTRHTRLLADTIKHEMAHVFAGVQHKHGDAWLLWAKRFGAKYDYYM